MKPSTVLLALSLSVCSAASSSLAAVLPFTFTPDLMLGANIEAAGSIITDDAPVVANIVAVTGELTGADIGGSGSAAINGIDLAGENLLVTSSLGAYFAFTATFGGVDYAFAFGPSAFSPYSLTMSGGRGPDLTAYGNLIIDGTGASLPVFPTTPVDPSQPPPFVSAVPLPASAPLLSGAVVLLGLLGFGLKHRRSTATA